jgi:2-hydroxychromene-2-carboxylate isomerase
MTVVALHFDFVSPYSWLALVQAEAFAAEHGIRWDLRPVVYAALLDAHGLVGPVEVPAKRRYTFRDVARCAHRAGRKLTGPPQHPFRSLEALRAMHLFREDPEAPRLAAQLADACWGDGRPLTDPGVLADVVSAVGLDAGGLAERSAAPDVKQGLRRATEEAVAMGVFGVPTFVHDGELFWGHDRMPHLAARIRGELPPADDLARAILARPRGAERRRGPAPG